MKSNRRAASSVRQRGFTMAEMLVVMAIIMVLSGIAAPSGMRVLNNVRQMSLNRSAETIYMTAQRNLIAYKVRGGNSTPPKDATGGYKVTSGDKSANPNLVNVVLPAKTISPTLYAGNWSIEYNVNFCVTKVYYSENTPLESLETVYESGELGKVGYYG